MEHIFLALYLCALFSKGLTKEFSLPVLHSIVLKNDADMGSPREFPKKSDSSTPILIGTNPKSTNLPPKMFPTEIPGENSTGPPILSVTDTKYISDIKRNHEAKIDTSNVTSSINKLNTTLVETHTELNSNITTEKLPAEQYDMLHSKYTGGQDVDELHPAKEESKIDENLKPVKKASEKDEKKQILPKTEPKSEVVVTPDFVKKGPKMMNDTKSKSGESLMESTSKIIAASSSVLSSSQGKQQGLIEPLKTVLTLLLSVIFILGAGVIGLLVWKRIAMRRFGRDILINEDDFDEISDMHTFDRAQIKIT